MVENVTTKLFLKRMKGGEAFWAYTSPDGTLILSDVKEDLLGIAKSYETMAREKLTGVM